MRYKVIKDYSETPQNPITIKKGEVLEFVEESDLNED